MMRTYDSRSRREFLGTVWAGTAAAMVAGIPKPVRAAATTRVAITAGEQRADNVFRALKEFSREIRAAIGSRRVVIKPNNVSTTVQLAATHAECLEGILEFLKSVGKSDIVIAESAASGPTLEGFENLKYISLARKYPVRFMDLDREPYELMYVADEKQLRPLPVRMSRLLLDPGTFLISAAMPKTHDRVIATLSLKNIIVGAALKDPGFSWGRNSAGVRSDKPVCHGGGIRGINYNLFLAAQRLHPHLAVIDGFDGMEGNGPTGGNAVPHRIAIAGLDWLAVDRVAVELMGIDFSKIGYLNYCARAALGEADLRRIQVYGQPLESYIIKYKLHDRYEQQQEWQGV
jgi:uncharacterized protein (DUF362 family)